MAYYQELAAKARGRLSDAEKAKAKAEEEERAAALAERRGEGLRLRAAKAEARRLVGRREQVMQAARRRARIRALRGAGFARTRVGYVFPGSDSAVEAAVKSHRERERLQLGS